MYTQYCLHTLLVAAVHILVLHYYALYGGKFVSLADERHYIIANELKLWHSLTPDNSFKLGTVCSVLNKTSWLKL